MKVYNAYLEKNTLWIDGVKKRKPDPKLVEWMRSRQNRLVIVQERKGQFVEVKREKQ